MLHFYTPWNGQKTRAVLTFLGGMETELWREMNSNTMKQKSWKHSTEASSEMFRKNKCS